MSASRVHISNGISKLGTSIPAVNLPPIATCRSDAPCKKQCYACKGRFCFSVNKRNMQQNLSVWDSDQKGFEADVIQAAKMVRFFRWHSAGDIPDVDYLDMMRHVAVVLPHTEFLCFTKKYEMVNAYLNSYVIPSNLHIVLSAWGDLIPDNPHNLPIAYVKLKSGEGADKIPNAAFPCHGYCGECAGSGHSCWDLRPGQSVYFNQH